MGRNGNDSKKLALPAKATSITAMRSSTRVLRGFNKLLPRQ